METEQEARENGWVPEEDFKSNPNNEGKKWRTAEEFMDRKSLFDKIDDQHREIKKLRDGVSALQQHNQQIETVTRERLLKELRAQKAEAVKEGDVIKIEELRDKIEEVKEAPPVVQVNQTQTPPEFQQWLNDNTWYSSDKEMRAFADAYGVAKHQEGKSPAEVLKEVSKKIKQAYPDKFRNPAKEEAPPIEGSSSRKGNLGKSDAGLSPMEEKIWNDLKRAGVPSSIDPKKKMTREEYVERLKSA
jgi:regulator of replication initiation timing